MIVLALAMIPLIVIPLVLDLSPAMERAFLSIDDVLWAVFAAEYGIKLYLAPNRRRFVARHIPDLIIVVVPMLRPLRVLRSVRLLRRCWSSSAATRRPTSTPIRMRCGGPGRRRPRSACQVLLVPTVHQS